MINEQSGLKRAVMAYRLRWKRRRLLFRALRKRRQLNEVVNRMDQVRPEDILLFATVRNEAVRLPYFLEHYRNLGVGHFVVVDNESTDGTQALLEQQKDVSLWRTACSYRLSRFGMDWLTYLQIKYAHKHWCLTVDADEILVYPHHDTRPLPALVNWLETHGRQSFGVLMLDMYPKGQLSEHPYEAGQDPFTNLCWFDAGNYMISKKKDLENLWIQGGVRARCFFADRPQRAPTMGKVPLVKWHRRYVYVSSSHSILPRRLNHVYDTQGGEMISGVLLHTKFLNVVVQKSEEEKSRQEHFANSNLYDAYYDAIVGDPDLWCTSSTRYRNWRQLVALGLMSKGNWV